MIAVTAFDLIGLLNYRDRSHNSKSVYHIYHDNSQRLVDKENRIHCSLNLNTETGRLSSRKPNLQNQPALEKDQYKISEFIFFMICTMTLCCDVLYSLCIDIVQYTL